MELREVFEPIVNFLKSLQRKDKDPASKEKAKERLQLVLLQDRASVSPDFFEMMKKEIIEVIKKYIEIDEESLEVQLTRGFEDGDETGPALYANIPIKNIKPVAKKVEEKDDDFSEDVNELAVSEAAVNSGESNNIDYIDENNSSEVTSNCGVETAEYNNEESNEYNNVMNVTSENSTVSDVDENTMQVEVIETEKNEEKKLEELDSETLSNMMNEIQEVAEAVIEKIEVSEETDNVNASIEAAEVISKEAKNENIEVMKEKLNEVKDGVAETFEKVKKGAKDGIKKIKTKTQKKIKE